MTYRRGSKGTKVEEIQARLEALGHYAGDVDGKLGAGTEKAVKVFQKGAGLGVDGKVGRTRGPRYFPDALAPEPTEAFDMAHRLSAAAHRRRKRWIRESSRSTTCVRWQDW